MAKRLHYDLSIQASNYIKNSILFQQLGRHY